MPELNRRQLLKQLAALGTLAMLPQRLFAQLVSAPAPSSEFGKSSTAEDVTAGMDLSGKTYVLTGANSGLGFETMRVLAQRGARVIGTARSWNKAEKACDLIDGHTTPEMLDLADWESVVACAARIRAMNITIDGLICNAGIVSIAERELVNGLEKHFVVNHLGHFILANQLMDEVMAAEQGRFVWVSSQSQFSAPDAGILFDDLAWNQHEYDPGTAYGHSKLANALCSKEMARRLSGTTATSNSLHPGVIVTNAIRNMSSTMQWLAKNLGWLFTKTVEEGAATQTYLATNSALGGVRGYYFDNCNPAEGSVHLQNDAMAKRLWEVSVELTREYLPIQTVET